MKNLKIAVCFYGAGNDTKLLSEKMTALLADNQVTLFQSIADDDSDAALFDSLYKVANKKRAFEIRHFLQFDVCIAVKMGTLDLLDHFTLEDVVPDKVYSLTGIFHKPMSSTGLGMEVFYCNSITFDRAAEFKLSVKNIDITRMRGGHIFGTVKEYLFYYHLKSLKFTTKCINYENSNLFKRAT